MFPVLDESFLRLVKPLTLRYRGILGNSSPICVVFADGAADIASPDLRSELLLMRRIISFPLGLTPVEAIVQTKTEVQQVCEKQKPQAHNVY